VQCWRADICGPGGDIQSEQLRRGSTVSYPRWVPPTAWNTERRGREASLFPAAEKVGPRGRIVGVDLSAGMVRELAADVERSTLRHISVCRMDAECLAFAEASFDAVLYGIHIPFRVLFVQGTKPG
jgi:hypothetical protein